MVAAYDIENYDRTYYVSVNGNDGTNDGLSESTPFATLEKTAGIINGLGTGGNYLVLVMTDLTSTACARYYGNSITITSLNPYNPVTVTRGASFTTLSDVMRGWYNPPMLEIESADLTPVAPLISLTLTNIIFDDAYRHAGTTYNYAPTWNGINPSTPPTGWSSANYVQDAIVASYANCATIILGDGAELHSFGGMTAARAADGATLVMEANSQITDIGSTAATRQLSTTLTDYRAVGETAVSISTGSHFYMYDGAKISNIANAHSVKLSGNYKCFIDGEITAMKGNRGWDATDHSTSATHEGRGPKSAVYFNGGTTLDPDTGNPGSAIIGPNANIHHNDVKCGAISISRSTAVSVKVFGKINDNVGQTGTSWQTVFGSSLAIPFGTNGGGIYIVAGGTIILEDGSEVCRNSVMNIAYGGGINIQQSGSKLIMNGGLVEGNTAGGMGPGIAVNKAGDCYFEMNGGTVENGPNGVLLFNNRAAILTAVREDNDCNSRLILNGGKVSGVTINSLVAYATNTANQYRNLYIRENVVIGTGYVAVAGAMQSATSTTNIPRQVKLLPANSFGDIYIGNPNKNLYPTISSALPIGWTMPSTTDNVIAFWIKKAGTADFSVPAPTSGSGGANYNTNLKYFAAVLETNAAGTASGTAIKLYPTEIKNGQIIVSVPLSTHTNGALVALVQPSSTYGEIEFDAPATLTYIVGDLSYTIPYTGEYDISMLLGELITDGHNELNTLVNLIIHPDPSTVPDTSSFDIISSDIFELDGTVIWNPVNWELVVPAKLKLGWSSPTANPVTTFEFDCTLDDTDFVDGAILSLTGELEIKGGPIPPKYYLISGNYANTELIVLKGDLYISKNLSGDAAEPTKDFHFTVTFSNSGTYDGVASGSNINLKGGESRLIADIPQGIEYTVTELEANQNGYTTTSTGTSGTISDELSEAIFTNTKNNLPPVDEAEYTVIYHGNGNTNGLAPVDNNSPYESGSKVTVMGQGTLAKTGHSFIGWSLTSTANTATYTSGSTFYITDNTLLYAIWKANSYTVTYQPGTHGTFTAQTTTGLHYGDTTPTAPTVTGDTDWTFTGWLPIPTAIVTDNATYVAQWTQTATPSPSATATPTPTPTPTPTITPVPTTTVTLIPTLTPAPTGSPSIGGEDDLQGWALFNLMLSIIGVILAIIVVIVCLLLPLMKKQKDEQKNIKNVTIPTQNNRQESEKQQKQHRKLWLITTLAMGIAGIIVFFLTEDMKLPMILIDKWSIVNAVILLVEIIAIAFTFKRKDALKIKRKYESNSTNLT
ncbi:MAG: DUF5979 domain-containing protein [Candidatus Bathyarchaeota archaeon]|nr:DUF5979 domain-containing protein [Candidatus Termiticorpusculum sp.]